MPEQDYYQLPFISQSSLKQFIRSPAEYHWEHVLKQGKSAGTSSTSLGSLVHCMLLEPQLLEELYHVYDESHRPESSMTMASKANKAWKVDQQSQAILLGKSLVAQEVYKQADEMVMAVCSHKLASSLLFPEEGRLVLTELAIKWKSLISELDLKSKLDRVLLTIDEKAQTGTCVVLDYKTTSASNLEAFGWSIRKYGYDVQAAFYEDAIRDYLELNYPTITFTVQLLFIPQKSTLPYQVLGVVELDKATVNAARTKYQRALQELEGCYHTGIWESQDSVQVLQLSKVVEDIFSPEEELLL